jgi:thiol:disulfide interchange protein DsbA
MTLRLSFAFSLLLVPWLLRAQTPAEQWTAGVDYTLMAPRQETDVPAGKIEVLELFMYTSPLSRDVQPFLSEWLKSKAGYIEFKRAPSIVFPHSRYQAQAFYTFMELGRDDLHDKFWAWVFDTDHYPTYHTIRHPDVAGYEKLNADFAAANGIDRAKFLETYASKKLDEQVIDAEIGAHNYHIAGTSTFVINGRYCVSVQRLVLKDPIRATRPEDFKRLFRLIDYLAAKDHDADATAR